MVDRATLEAEKLSPEMIMDEVEKRLPEDSHRAYSREEVLAIATYAARLGVMSYQSRSPLYMRYRVPDQARLLDEELSSEKMGIDDIA